MSQVQRPRSERYIGWVKQPRWSVHQRVVYLQVLRVETETSVANCCYTPTTSAYPSCVEPSALALVRGSPGKW